MFFRYLSWRAAQLSERGTLHLKAAAQEVAVSRSDSLPASMTAWKKNRFLRPSPRQLPQAELEAVKSYCCQAGVSAGMELLPLPKNPKDISHQFLPALPPRVV